jgi:SAM-dependent MidA family methyltransferase
LQIAELIHERGPTTVAAFMDLALYHPELGYYTRVARRTGRAGDFFTSVDVGPLFGDLIADQIAEMARLLVALPFDFVEVGAGDGRLAADVLGGLRERHPDVYNRTRLHLVEASGPARAAQAVTLAGMTDRLATSSPSMPEHFTGVLLANELLDAMPVHQVVMRPGGLREVFVVSDGRTLTTCEAPPSTPALAACLLRQGVHLGPGCRAEIGLRAQDWMREAAHRLRAGFMILFDYGHEAAELYSATHAGGTLTTFSGHRSTGVEGAADAVPWLERPGDQDITSHVNFTDLAWQAEQEGLDVLAFLDQTYFVMGLASGRLESLDATGRRAFRTLLMPGGLGSTMKVMILGRAVGKPSLACCSAGIRAT